jgi:hypothetical protein
MNDHLTRAQRAHTAAQMDLAAALLDAIDRLPLGHGGIEIRRDDAGKLHVRGPLSYALRQRIADAYEAEANLPQETEVV